MGKTAKGAVWLDENKTTPYEFYQYWRNIDDGDVKNCMKLLTFLPLEQIEELCHEKDIVFIVDEVQTGFGRCGTLFAHELFGVKPDIMTMAKGIGGGVPMGGILATEKVASAFVPGDHGTTFGGGPLVCAAANAVLDVFDEENILDNVNEVGEYFIEQLKGLDKEIKSKIKNLIFI